jgi:hypothetical protein
MNEPLERAKRDLALLEDQIAGHDDAIRRHEADKALAVKTMEEVRTFIRLFDLYSLNDATIVLEATAKSISGLSNTERVTRLAEEEIRRTLHRVKTDTVYQAAMADGVPIGGKDDDAKRNNVSGMLSRDHRFNGVRRRGWWLNALGPCPDDPPENTETADHDLEGTESAASAEPRPTSERGPSEARGPVAGRWDMKI